MIDTISLTSGTTTTVMITNIYTSTTGSGSGTATVPLIVIKHVINTGGGTEAAGAFTLHVQKAGVDVTGGSAVGLEAGRTYDLAPGTYVVSEGAAAGYTASYSSSDPNSSGGSITLRSGETGAKVTITNTYTPSSGESGGGGGWPVVLPSI
jgi:hypothetical protein